MAIAVRNGFDLDGDFVVSVEVLRFRGETFSRGKPLPWRRLGLSPVDLYQLYIALQVDCSSAAQPIAPSPPAAEVVLDAPGVATADVSAELGKREKRARSRSSAAAPR